MSTPAQRWRFLYISINFRRTAMITALELTKKLISLPSYLGGEQDELPAINFLADFLAESFPAMTVERQYLENSKRCNLILRGKDRPKLFVLGHIDTVQPKTGW